MAVVVPTVVALGGGAQQITWSGMNTGDSGAFMSGLAKYPNKTVAVSGTTVTSVDIKGQDGSGGTAIINDSRGEGNPLSFTAADIREVLENPDKIQPVVTTGTAVIVQLTVR